MHEFLVFLFYFRFARALDFFLAFFFGPSYSSHVYRVALRYVALRCKKISFPSRLVEVGWEGGYVNPTTRRRVRKSSSRAGDCFEDVHETCICFS